MKKIFTLVFLTLISCKATRPYKSDCHENIKFKKSFFNHIKYVENNIGAAQDSTFKKSLIFILNYAPVSENQIMNYDRSYSIGIFQQDYVKWIQWYEENKCGNIQFKDRYFVPEVYQEMYESEYITIKN